MKRYVLVAGANGVGKSTLYATHRYDFDNIEKINFDEIVKELGDWRKGSVLVEAARRTNELIDRFFDEGLSFCQETTLCGRSIRKNIERAKGLGYSLEMVYIGVNSVDIAKRRIQHRVERGGHGVPEEDIERRYKNSFEALKALITEFDYIDIYDNSKDFVCVAVFQKGQCVYKNPEAPHWFDILFESKDLDEEDIDSKNGTTLSVYPACFFKESNGYSVVFPDLNWLATCGKNESDAMNRAVDCLAGYLYTLEKDGDRIPKPSSIKDISLENVAEELDVDPKDGFVSLVSVEVKDYVKKH